MALNHSVFFHWLNLDVLAILPLILSRISLLTFDVTMGSYDGAETCALEGNFLLSQLQSLDVTFNLNAGNYQSFTKPNTTLQYVRRESNHSSTTTKNIPAGINIRLSSLSSDKISFDQAAPPYQKALDDSGYRYTLRSFFFACL